MYGGSTFEVIFSKTKHYFFQIRRNEQTFVELKCLQLIKGYSKFSKTNLNFSIRKKTNVFFQKKKATKNFAKNSEFQIQFVLFANCSLNGGSLGNFKSFTACIQKTFRIVFSVFFQEGKKQRKKYFCFKNFSVQKF